MAKSTFDTAFIEHLHEEKLHTQADRTRYVAQKLAFVTGLMGLGSLGIGGESANFDFGNLLLLAPWVATAFDLYVLGEDYSVKRIGAFLEAYGQSDAEHVWETWVTKHRDHFAPLAMPLLTTVVLVGAAAIISAMSRAGADTVVATGIAGFWTWFGVTLVPTWFLYFFYQHLKRGIAGSLPSSTGSNLRLERLTGVVHDADRVLDWLTYRVTSRLFAEAQAKPGVWQAIRDSSQEYGRDEFLLNVDRGGAPVVAHRDILDDYRRTIATQPDFARWFQEAALPDGRPTLLISRWLCHAVGFRHRSVELFLDHPVLPDHTLLQVRGFDKAEAPGLLDLPAAGHVSGTDAVELTLERELHEELGLQIEGVDNLQKLGEYPYADAHNAEYRTVYRGQLRREDLLRLSGDDDEVAAIVSISVEMVKQTLATQPERFASGLRASFKLYKQRDQ